MWLWELQLWFLCLKRKSKADEKAVFGVNTAVYIIKLAYKLKLSDEPPTKVAPYME